jgi:hypothetical protein
MRRSQAGRQAGRERGESFLYAALQKTMLKIIYNPFSAFRNSLSPKLPQASFPVPAVFSVYYNIFRV